MATVNLSPLAGAGWQFFTNSGVPLAGGLLYTYLAGTTTPATTYTSNTGLTANANPIVLDSAGRTTNETWNDVTKSYKFVLKTAAGVTIGTYDNLIDATAVVTSALLAYEAAMAASSGASLVGFINSPAGSVATTLQAWARLQPISPTDFGAVGDGVTNDSAAFVACSTAAASTSPPRKIRIPGGRTYLCASAGPAITAVDDLVIDGDGHPLINFTGAGEFLSNTGKRNVVMNNVKIVGNGVANAVAIRHKVAVAGALNCEYRNNIITGFGTATTGGGISIESDSQNLKIGPNNLFSNYFRNVSLTAPTDNLDIGHNIWTFPGVGIHVYGASPGGDGAKHIHDNNFQSEVAGGALFNLSGGSWVLARNEFESLASLTATNNAAANLSGGTFEFCENVISLHNVTNGDYCLWAADTAFVKEHDNTYSGFNVKAVRNHAAAECYWRDGIASTGPGSLYTTATPMITMLENGAQAGVYQGSLVPPLGASYSRNGIICDGPTNYTNAESGANNAIITTWGAPLAVGLELWIPLNHSLQIGANTLSYIGAGVTQTATAIKSCRNPANNIATAYAAGGFITVRWNGAVWLDTSQ